MHTDAWVDERAMLGQRQFYSLFIYHMGLSLIGQLPIDKPRGNVNLHNVQVILIIADNSPCMIIIDLQKLITVL